MPGPNVSFDILTTRPFSVMPLTLALEDVRYVPQFIESLGLFVDVPVANEFVAVERRGNSLRLIPTSERGAPLPQRTPEGRNIRGYRTPRVAAGDRINASEIFGVRAFGTTNEQETVSNVILTRGNALRNDWNATMEYHRLGALLGVVMDANGTDVIVDWFAEWGITPPTEIGFNLTVDGAGSIRAKLTGVYRTMQIASNGLWGPGASVGALAGDNFFDKLIANKEVRETYLNQQRANDLREGVAPFQFFDYGGVRFWNYRGTDTGNLLKIDTDEVKFFPMGVPGVFQRALSPGESLDLIGTLGRPFYFWQIPDKDRNMWTDVEVYSYPLHICTRPEMLLTGKVGV